MKPLLAIAVALLLNATVIFAGSKPLGRSLEINRPLSAVYQSLSIYFSPDSMHDFQIVSAGKSKSHGQFVARRTLEDKVKWSDWAYCKVPALQLLDTLQEGNITVTVKLERDTANSTYVTVTPEFSGVYEFNGQSRTKQCQSKGVLEADILRAAGAPDSDLN